MSQHNYHPLSPMGILHNQSVLTVLFFMLFAFLALFKLGNVGLFDVDEAIFAQASVEMMESENYIKPTYNGEPRYQKPPMIYWLQVASMHVYGQGPLGARLPSALLAIATLFVFYSCLLAASKRGRYALLATAILGLNLSFLAITRAAVADMLLNFFIISSTFAFLQALYSYQQKTMLLVVGGFLLAGGFLAKGPIAILVPAAVVGVAFLLRGNYWANLKRLNPFVVLGALLLALVPWCWAIFKQTGPDFFIHFILFENWERFSTGLTNTHSSSPLYYLVVLAVGFFPWAFFLPSAFLAVVSSFVRRVRSHSLEQALPALGLVWLVAVVVFFSFSATKLAHYIVPALPGAAMLLAWRLEDVPNRPLFSLHWPVVMATAAGAAIVLGGLKFLPSALLGKGALAMPIGMLMQSMGATWPVEKPQVVEILAQSVPVSLAPLMAGCVVVLGLGYGLWLAIGGYRQGVVAMVFTVWMALILVVVGVVPVVYNYTQQPLANIAFKVQDNFQKGDQLYMVKLHQPSVRYISEIPFKPINNLNQLNDVYPPFNGTAFFVTKSQFAPQVITRIKANQVADECQGGWCLIIAK